MQRRNILSSTALVALLLSALASSAAADTSNRKEDRVWKIRAVWCASDLPAEGKDTVGRLAEHAAAHARYCAACRAGKDQYDAIGACYEDKPQALDELKRASRDDVNRFMKNKVHDCCTESVQPPLTEPTPQGD